MSPCKWINLPNGGVAHVNMGHSKPKRCKFCTHGTGAMLCDFTVGQGKTCDAPMCERCATEVGLDLHHCPTHKGKTAEVHPAMTDTAPTLFDMSVPQTAAPKPAPKPKRQPGWFPKNSTELLMRGYEFLNDGKCKQEGCSAAISWWETPTGKRIPINYMPTPDTPAVPHWTTCTNPARFRGGSK